MQYYLENTSITVETNGSVVKTKAELTSLLCNLAGIQVLYSV